jgi:hypothetical protein
MAGLLRQDRDNDLGDRQRARRRGRRGDQVCSYEPADETQPAAAAGQHPRHRDRQQRTAPACPPARAQRYPDRRALAIRRPGPGYEDLEVAS